MSKKNILDFSLEELKLFLQESGEAQYHAAQIFSWVFKLGVLDFSQMSNLSLALRNKLAEKFAILSFTLKEKLASTDGTQKLLLELAGGNFIEAVIIPAEGRVTGCISSQVGCKFKCGFCASGVRGFKRDLSAGEMVEEILWLKSYAPDKALTHIVFMGTGEPLDNYDNVIKAIKIINSKEGLTIGARRITLSTCGLIPGIRRLSEEKMQFELSVSLHAADEKTRSMLMPVNKKYPLAELIAACREYFRKTGRQITFEYILIAGLNSDLQSAQKLSILLQGMDCKVNLIPSNPIHELKIAPPKKLEILLFKDHLLKHGVHVTLRKERGQDIDAACGQLRLRYVEK